MFISYNIEQRKDTEWPVTVLICKHGFEDKLALIRGEKKLVMSCCFLLTKKQQHSLKMLHAILQMLPFV